MNILFYKEGTFTKLVKIIRKIHNYVDENGKESERIETEIEAEPELGEKADIETIDGDKVINGKLYLTGNSTQKGEF